MIVGVGPYQHPDRRAPRIDGRDDGAPGLRQVEVARAHGGLRREAQRPDAAHPEGPLPCAVSATRYHVLFLTTSPSGSTVRDEVRPSLPR